MRVLIIGGFPRKDQPIFNHRLRKAVLAGAKVMVINPVDFSFNYELADKCIESPAKYRGGIGGRTEGGDWQDEQNFRNRWVAEGNQTEAAS